MSGLRRTWVVPVAVADAWTLLPTPGTSDEPPLYQGPWSPGGGQGIGDRCSYGQRSDRSRTSGWRLALICPWGIQPLWCL